MKLSPPRRLWVAAHGARWALWSARRTGFPTGESLARWRIRAGCFPKGSSPASRRLESARKLASAPAKAGCQSRAGAANGRFRSQHSCSCTDRWIIERLLVPPLREFLWNSRGEAPVRTFDGSVGPFSAALCTGPPTAAVPVSFRTRKATYSRRCPAFTHAEILPEVSAFSRGLFTGNPTGGFPFVRQGYMFTGNPTGGFPFKKRSSPAYRGSQESARKLASAPPVGRLLVRRMRT